LHVTALFNHPVFAFLLCEHGADVDAKDFYGRTPLAIAAEHGKLAVARVLLAAGASVTTNDSMGLTALHYAAQSGHLKAVTFLIERGAQINARDKEVRGIFSSLHAIKPDALAGPHGIAHCGYEGPSRHR